MKRPLIVLIVLILSFLPVSISVGQNFSTHGEEIKQTTYVLICDSKSAYAFHDYYCQGLKRCTHQVYKVTLEDAKKMGRRACGYCYR